MNTFLATDPALNHAHEIAERLDGASVSDERALAVAREIVEDPCCHALYGEHTVREMRALLRSAR